jgi:hypothetical protein
MLILFRWALIALVCSVFGFSLGFIYPVIVVGRCVILVVIFIVLSVTVPSLSEKVYPYARRGK